MRSRYTAYTLGREDYLLATWHPSTRPASLNLDEPPVPKWLGLKVVSRQQTGPNNALVAFVARYKVGGRAYRLEETSRFERLDGRWYYVDGNVRCDVRGDVGGNTWAATSPPGDQSSARISTKARSRT